MNLLINEPPLQVLPSLAVKIGLNEALFLQQLHYRLLISTNVRDGYKWIYKTYAEWRNEEFPFWSVETVKRTITKLSKADYIIATSEYNRLKMDKTKWYRINYEKLSSVSTGQNDLSDRSKRPQGEGQNDLCDEVKMTPAIPKDIKSIKNNNVELELDVVNEVINYLNSKAHKSFKSTTNVTKKLIHGRLRDGYTLEDFKNVINIKIKSWLNNPEMNKYLRPSTLFSATNFESYLNEIPALKKQQPSSINTTNTTGPLNLDFTAGEDIG